ncbi:lytic transglycosylase domain-containing protein [Mesorhizobium sp. WSM4976]|uniref:lytic transglycosylase domain-containing protein n=1 Tax=Mesorhizobium sp. WSM4976 TaxID=3038549 RepID=UPI0024173923|nr:lytic transglycosylase domain-containing protein [Mesorhizobium sp. WSM4976]MDG4898619.1 lytic transglycosylase domain-containing protein [Mesorhizobium sp. WSM4976]
MDRVTLLMLGMASFAPCACSAATGAPPAVISQGPELERWQRFVSDASRRFDIPESWIYAVMDAESRGQTMLNGRPITSRAGAIGLMQVMPGTYEELRVAHGLGPDPQDPRDNILAGTAYLRAMYDRFGFPGLFAAYNAGPDRYEAHLQRGKSLPRETVLYLEQLEAAGVSADEMDAFKAKSRPPKGPKVSSGRELFFLKDGVSGSGSSGEILVLLGPRPAGSSRPDGR